MRLCEKQTEKSHRRKRRKESGRGYRKSKHLRTHSPTPLSSQYIEYNATMTIVRIESRKEATKWDGYDRVAFPGEYIHTQVVFNARKKEKSSIDI